jgi:hypothetical protein
MKKTNFFIILLAILLCLNFCGSGEDEFEKAGEEFVRLLEAEQFEEAANSFDQTMTDNFGADKLTEVWHQLQDQAGRFQKQLSTRREKYQQYEIVFVTCQFERTKLDIKVVYNQSKQVAGLWLVPPQ